MLNKMAEEKKEEKKDKKKDKKVNVQERLDAVAAKNEQIKMIEDLQNENARLKDNIGNRKRGSREPSAAGRIQGLQTIKNTLGRQFMRRQSY
jgi:hypothetical protein